MSYYNIRCVHCLRRMKSHEVLYKLDVDSLSDGYVEYDLQEDSDISDDVNFSEIGSAMSGMGNDSVGSYDTDFGTEIMVIGDKIADYANDVRPITNEDIRLPKSVFNADMVCDGVLTIGYKVIGLKIGRKQYDGVISKRYCPNCKKLLLKQAGEVPVFIIAMIGHSTAGKTVFLTMESFANSHNKYNSEIDKGIIDIKTITNHLHSTEIDIIEQAASNFEKTGEFPSTTQQIPLPHCMLVNYREKEGKGSSAKVKSESDTTCIICYRDAMGELFTRTDTRNEESQRTAEICRNADALMVLTDPFSLSVPRAKIHTGKLQMDTDSLNAMIQILLNIFENIDRAVDKPTVCLMTKTDALFEYCDQLDLDPTDPINAEAFSSKFFYNEDKNWADKVFNVLQNSTRKILKQLDKDGNWVKNLELTFVDNTAYLPLSSIGNKVKILDVNFEPADDNHESKKDSVKKIVTSENWSAFHNEAVDIHKGDRDRWIDFTNRINCQQVPYNEVNPRFIELPLIYFLSLFRMIPPITESIYAKSRDENFSEWYDKCAMKTVVGSETFKNGSAPVYANKKTTRGILSFLRFGRR